MLMLGSRAAVRSTVSQVRGRRCRSSAARAKCCTLARMRWAISWRSSRQMLKRSGSRRAVRGVVAAFGREAAGSPVRPPNAARERTSGSSPTCFDLAAGAHAAASGPPALRQRRSRSRAISAVNSSRWRSMPLSLDPNSRPFICITGPRRRIRGWVRFLLSCWRSRKSAHIC